MNGAARLDSAPGGGRCTRRSPSASRSTSALPRAGMVFVTAPAGSGAGWPDVQPARPIDIRTVTIRRIWWSECTSTSSECWSGVSEGSSSLGRHATAQSSLQASAGRCINCTSQVISGQLKPGLLLKCVYGELRAAHFLRVALSCRQPALSRSILGVGLDTNHQAREAGGALSERSRSAGRDYPIRLQPRFVHDHHFFSGPTRGRGPLRKERKLWQVIVSISWIFADGHTSGECAGWGCLGGFRSLGHLSGRRCSLTGANHREHRALNRESCVTGESPPCTSARVSPHRRAAFVPSVIHCGALAAVADGNATG